MRLSLSEPPPMQELPLLLSSLLKKYSAFPLCLKMKVCDFHSSTAQDKVPRYHHCTYHHIIKGLGSWLFPPSSFPLALHTFSISKSGPQTLGAPETLSSSSQG
jgi:hypothetical protein